MSLTLEASGRIDCSARSGTRGRGFMDNAITVCDLDIETGDFAELVMYYLTNTDLEPRDVRRELVDRIRSLREVEGWNTGNVRYEGNQGIAAADPNQPSRLGMSWAAFFMSWPHPHRQNARL